MTLPETTPDGRPIVKNWGARAFTPGAIRTTAEQKEAMLAEGRLMSGARLIGDLTLLDVGFTVWSRERQMHYGDDHVPLGGTIVERREQRDPETGEIAERAFVCIDEHRCRPVIKPAVLQVDEIDRGTMEGPLDGRLRYLVRRFAEEIANSKGALTPRLLELDRWQHALVAVVAGQRW